MEAASLATLDVQPALRRALLGIAVALIAIVAVASSVDRPAMAPPLGPSIALLAALFLVALPLWMNALVSIGSALLGFSRRLHRARPAPQAEAPLAEDGPLLPATAVIMPVYHESPSRVLAAAVAMREQLLHEPGTEHFEIFVLSDSRDPERAAEEERAVRRVTPNITRLPIHYRRRARNDLKKTGNIAEFLERWGGRFAFAIVLDADSLMRGRTMTEMVARMVKDPTLGLLQAPIFPHGGKTLFARWQQFSAWLVGPVATSGLASWSGNASNYFGHNAVLRVRAFLECCGLPELEGRRPLGGPILSHDFVEAALLVRGGWSVRQADDLEGSYEELPPTLSAFVDRDRRWCQGNLQHLRIAFATGLDRRSRMHLLLGAFGYLSAPLWALFLVLANLSAWVAPVFSSEVLLPFLIATLTLPMIPRVLGLLDLWLDRERRQGHGGTFRIVISTCAEVLLGALAAPVFMVLHTAIVVGILAGRSTSWGAQARDADGESVARREAQLRLGTAALGGFILIGSAWLGTHTLLWLLPVAVPLLLAPLLAALLSSEPLGAWAARMGLFLIPVETRGDPLIDHATELRAQLRSDAAGSFRDLVLDPALNATHLARLNALPRVEVTDESSVEKSLERALRGGPTGIDEAERTLLSQHPQTMRILHREAWKRWPVEGWRLVAPADGS